MDPDSDPTPDPTPFFSDFKDAKKIIFFPPYFFLHIFFLWLSQRHMIFGLKNIIFCQIFVLKSYFASIISEKGSIRIRIRTSDKLIRILEPQKHPDHLDPQHW